MTKPTCQTQTSAQHRKASTEEGSLSPGDYLLITEATTTLPSCSETTMWPQKLGLRGEGCGCGSHQWGEQWILNIWELFLAGD